jgi:signal transduction histidine kinase
MVWLLPRLLATVGLLVLGGLLGERLGQWVQLPIAGTLLGAVVGASLAVLVDVLRAARLMLWLRGTQERDAPPLSLAGAEAELVSAVANLATNAVRYTPDGGQINLAWQLRGDGSVEIEVRDTGVGIAREHIPRLTERFYRVDGSRARETGGTGLGLAIVKHVVQRHGGALDVDSNPGRGSRFRLLFPAARVRLATQEQGVGTPA